MKILTVEFIVSGNLEADALMSYLQNADTPILSSVKRAFTAEDRENAEGQGISLPDED